MAAREYLYVVTETAYGVPKVTPVAGVDSFYIRLDGGNAFTMRPKPKMFTVMYGGGRATPALTGSGETEVKGSLTTKLYAAQSGLIMNWCATVINAGQTLPWVTTEPPGDLASVSIYHAVQRVDGTYKKKWYPGVKVDKWKVEAARESQVATLSIELCAQKVNGNTYDVSVDPTTLFITPTEADYPTDPYLFSHTAGQLKIGNAGVARVGYESVSIESDNVLHPYAGELRWLQYCRFLGRNSKLNAKLLLKATPDDRAAYEAITTQATSLEFNNTTHQLTIDFKGQNYFNEAADDLSLEKMYEQGLMLQNLWDASASTDLAIVFV